MLIGRDVATTNSKPVGKVPTTTILVALSGPLLVTLIVKTNSSPTTGLVLLELKLIAKSVTLYVVTFVTCGLTTVTDLVAVVFGV